MRSFSQLLLRWSQVHAFAMIAGTLGTLALSSALPVLLTAAGMFIILAEIGTVGSPDAVFSRANGVTTLRLVGIGGLACLAITGLLSGYWLALGATLVLLTDAVDGWLARRHDKASEFGALLDEEVDAFFLLTLCTLAFVSGHLDWWILLPGLLRYAFLLARPFLDQGTDPIKLRSRRARILFVVMMGAMITTLIPLPDLYRPAAVGASLLLGVSFMIDTWKVARSPASPTVAKN